MSQQVVFALLFFYLVVGGDYHTNKELLDEERRYYHRGYEQITILQVIVALWLHIHSYSVDTIVHDVHPARSGHHDEDCEHSLEDIVEVLVFPYPDASQVKAFPLGGDILV